MSAPTARGEQAPAAGGDQAPTARGERRGGVAGRRDPARSELRRHLRGRGARRAPPRGRRRRRLRPRQAGARRNLRPGSDPGALPGPVLIADRDNNRLARGLADGPRAVALPGARTTRAGPVVPLLPDDAFFAPDGRRVVVTQEDDYVISVINLAGHRSSTATATPECPAPNPATCTTPTTPC